MGQGLRAATSGTLTEAGLAVLRLDRLRALVDVYPGRRARGRDGRRVRLLPPRPRRRGAVDRHRDARARRGRPRRPPPPGLGDRARDRRRRRGADPALLRRPGRVGRLAPAGLPARASTWPRSAGANPEAIGAILGGHGITAWGDTSDECEARSLEIIRTAERFIAEHGRPEPFGAAIAGLRAAARGRPPRPGGGPAAAHPRPRLDRPAAGRPLHGQRRRARLPRPRRAPAPGRARHLLPGPLPADQGPADGPRPATDAPSSSRRRRPPARAPRGVPRRLRRLLRAPRDAGQPGDARRRPGDRPRPRRRDVLVRGEQADRPGRGRVLRQRDQRHARRRGALDLRADRRERRSSGSSTGRSRRPSSSGCPSPSRWPRGSRS